MNLSALLVLNSVLVGVTLLLAVADVLLGRGQQTILRINQGKTFPISSGISLLASLAEQKIFLPSACGGKGTCGQCKVQVVSGGGERLPTEEGLLTPREKKENYRLACQVRVREDLEINVPGEVLQVEEYTTEVMTLEDLNHNVKFLRLKLLSPPTIKFKTGQFIQIFIPGYDEYRAYSLASPSRRKTTLDLMIRYEPKGLGSTYIHKALQVGDQVKITGPYGNQLVIREGVHKIVMVAGGIGISPFAGLAEDVVDNENIEEAKLIYGVNQEKEFIHDARFQELAAASDKFEYIKVVAFDQDWQGEKGFVTDVLKRMDLKGYKVYMCGPPPMVEASQKVLADLGVPEHDIYYETQ